MDYKILWTFTIWGMQMRVKKLLKEWYRPKWWIYKTFLQYYQVMYRDYEKEEKK